jgi:hypothetical protein
MDVTRIVLLGAVGFVAGALAPIAGGNSLGDPRQRLPSGRTRAFGTTRV